MLKGKGVAGKLTFTPSSLKFPDVALGDDSPLVSVVVHNPHPVPVPITSIALAGGDFAIVSRTCDSSLPAGADCVIDVEFDPNAVGARAGALRVFARTPKNLARG